MNAERSRTTTISLFLCDAFFVCPIFRYLIDTRWFKQLKKYLGLDLESGSSSERDPSAHPGPIDNSPLFKNEPDEPGEPLELREHMIDELDFVLAPEDAWALLLEEFTLTQGQEPIARKVNNVSMYSFGKVVSQSSIYDGTTKSFCIYVVTSIDPKISMTVFIYTLKRSYSIDISKRKLKIVTSVLGFPTRIKISHSF